MVNDNKKYICEYKAPFGVIIIGEKNGKITNVSFDNIKESSNVILRKTNTLKKAISQLDEYFSGKRKQFDLEYDFEDSKKSNFLVKVWKELLKIPYGKTVTYEDIAKNIGNKKACRAVGMANNKNPIAIFVPCHRVIGKNGKLTGYYGGINIKEYLLNLEKENDI